MPRPRLYVPDVDRPITNTEIVFEFDTFDTNWNTFYTYLLPVGRGLKVDLDLQANESGANFALFSRKGMFWRDNLGVKFRSGWMSLVDDKTQKPFSVQYFTTGQYVLLQAKSFTSNKTHWKATMKWVEVSQ